MVAKARSLLQFIFSASFLVFAATENDLDRKVAVQMKMKPEIDMMCNFPPNDCCPKWNGRNATESGSFVEDFRQDLNQEINGSDASERSSYRNYDTNYEIKDISDVFFQYNYSYQNIPANLAHIGTQLLDAESVRYFRDYDDEVVFLGKGSFGEVYLAEMVESKQVVAVKLFLDSDYLDIISEVIITQYLSDTGVIPKILGLLPTGPMTSNLSLVQEYVSGMTLEDHLNEENETTLMPINWLNISLQLAVGLQKIHQKYVLLNDIHEGNVLVEPPHLRVVYIDMGHATFRSGYKYNNYNGSLYTYEHLAPELRKSQPGTPASDVYSLGSLLSRISNISRIEELEKLANQCLQTQPEMRPTLSDLVTSLKDLFEKEKHKIERKRVKFQDFSNIKPNNYPPLIHYNVPILGPDAITDIQNGTSQDDDSENGEAASNDTLVPMYIYLGGTRAKVHIGTLVHCKCVVMIRAYENGSFERILEESRILLHLKDTGAVFPFHGLLPTGNMLDEFEIVQSYFVPMVSVANIFQRYSLRMTDTEILAFFIHISVHLLEVHRKRCY
ncbi:PRKCQ [Acanthosepion pharaonis]|uniref:PRKCQ n=1 Tax=Acanthosepion pharaonis TaxID=158019 RepID=A0A812C7L9_ACAPH|nr:PRKCQ [Sepia pharaonis]